MVNVLFPPPLPVAPMACPTNPSYLPQAFDPECASGPLPPHLMVPPALRSPDDGPDGITGRVSANDVDKVRARSRAVGAGLGQPDGRAAGNACNATTCRQLRCCARCAGSLVVQVRYVLKNVVRDWSDEGAAERLLSYGRILAELKEGFKDW